MAGGLRPGFTLIELLVVISIMAILAAFTLSVTGGIKRRQWVNTATAELTQIQSALDDYKAKYGVYPPSNANPSGTYISPMTNSMFPPLFYELCGVTNVVPHSVFQPLDGSLAISYGPPNLVQTAFGVSGFINCSQGSGEDTMAARNFLMGLKQNRISSVTNNGVLVTLLVTSVGGPDTRYQPLGAQSVNPFRYVYPGINNPSSYDLWVNLVINNKTNLICNWSPTPLINSAYP